MHWHGASRACLVLALCAAHGPSSAEGLSGKSSAGNLDEIVVTASAGGRSRIASAISVSSVDARLIEAFRPSSEAELYRLLPGIQVAGTAGPGGNANIAVRGLPVATGGAPFVQIQEDGLPAVLFGDILFGNNDYWTRFDASTARVEAVRGGTAATFASQAPGAVINYISHAGDVPGGHIELDRGLGYREARIDFRHGGQIADGLRYHVGGYHKWGRGPQRADFGLSNSVQVKANLTRTFDDGSGWLRLLVKFADTREPFYTGAPALATLSGDRISGIRPFPGFDGRRGTNYSTLNRDFLIVNRDGALERVAMSGITTRTLAIQGQFHRRFGDSVEIDNNMRWTRMSGAFAAPFFTAAPTAVLIGSVVNGAVVDSVRHANGPLAGQPYEGAYYNRNTNVRTNIRDIGSFVNDLSITGRLGQLAARAGWFHMKQKMEMDWHPNRVFSAVSGNNPAMLDLYDAAGNRLTANGTAGFNTNWGPCCARDYDLSYTNDAAYLGLDLDNGVFAIDGSLRLEMLKASGWAVGGSAQTFPTLVTVDGITTSIPTAVADGVRETIGYRRSYVSWTAGGLWRAGPDVSLFARASRGGRFNGDRQTLSGKINADGSLNRAGRLASVDHVMQYEVGLKARGGLAGGQYSVELTLLAGRFSRSDFEPTQTVQCPAGGCVIDTRYRSRGGELFATYGNGPFSLVSSVTYMRAERAAAGAGGYRRADGIPDLTYTVSLSHDIARIATLGLGVTGQTGVTDGRGLDYPGKAIFNAMARLRPTRNVELGVQLYNLFDSFDLRGAGNVVDANATPIVIGGTPVLGRTATASLRYSF